ncbi:ArsR/SmtB family transcription factor [Rhizobium wuzhouense]|uniref:Transcriptional regulator n=1 Tax=Rhizobium wuzhouense TaxID=1986026 RepID=A0ABX5NUS6_9HYPH|nr:metalloregulator ArsR/SmtB family transcription factor [Rhizobium wuzhouense]PYB76922.1 transcriptional regulator [Rhizobium wuzhouense]
MVQQSAAQLDAAFAALADATRRGVLEELGRSEASITRLADRFAMSLTGMKKHVALLEEAGLVTSQKLGRVRVCRIETEGLGEVAAWIAARRKVWNDRFDALDTVLETLLQQERPDEQA